MITKEMLCPKCHGQIELSENGRFFECPLCGYKEIIEENDIISKERIRSNTRKEIALGQKKLDIDAKKEEHEFELEKEKLRMNSSKNGFRYIIIIIIVLAILIGSFFCLSKYIHRDQIQTKMNPEDYIGENYKVVEAELRDAGFTNITIEEKADLGMSQSNQFGNVSQVSIAGDISFKKNKWFEKNVPVIIIFHNLDPAKKDDIEITESSTSYVGLNYLVVAEKIRAMGIKNVELQAIYDVGLFSKIDEGSVEKVLIDGDKDFYSGEWVSKNKTVKIYYHAKKSQQDADEQLIEVSTDDIILKNSQKEFEGQNYKDILNLLKNEGFCNITLQALGDLKSEVIHNDGEVKSVSFSGQEKYKSGTVFSKDAEIIITYHSLTSSESDFPVKNNDIAISHSKKEFKNENYENVVKMLKDDGFYNIITKPLCDLTDSESAGIFDDIKNKLIGENGNVKNITLNGDDDFKSGDKFPIDSEIIIEYHSLSTT